MSEHKRKVSDEKMAEFKEALAREAEKRGYFYDKYTGCCAQSTLLPIQELFGLGDKMTYKAATLFFGGVSGSGHACGALVGGVMALGLKYGREEPDVERSHSEVQDVGFRLVKWFEKEYGTTSCREIIGYDLSDKKAKEEFLASAVHEECFQRCGKVARKVAEILNESG